MRGDRQWGRDDIASVEARAQETRASPSTTSDQPTAPLQVLPLLTSKNTVVACHRRGSHHAHCQGTARSQSSLCLPKSPNLTASYLLGSRATRLQLGQGSLQTAHPPRAVCFPSAGISRSLPVTKARESGWLCPTQGQN